jgi:proteasome lid subunit RPN8/RPN11
VVQVLRSAYTAMVDHALETPTFECCGLLAGRNGTITRAFPAANIARRKEVRYEAAPSDVLRILEAIESAGDEHLGIYHSHPASEARPSPTDERLAAYDVWYFVISLKSRTQPDVRAFRLDKDHPSDKNANVREEPIETVDQAPR